MEKRRSVSRGTHKPGQLSVHWTEQNTLKGGEMKLEKPTAGQQSNS